MSELKLGMKCFYVPQLDHAFDTGRDGLPIFHWVHVQDHNNVHRVRAGDLVDWNKVHPPRNVGDPLLHVREPSHVDFGQGAALRGPWGHLMRPDRPKAFWPAVVVANLRAVRARMLNALMEKHPAFAQLVGGLPIPALEELCNAVGLSIPLTDPSDGFLLEWAHPNGCQTGCYPLQGPSAVTFDPEKKRPHSYHFAEGA